MKEARIGTCDKCGVKFYVHAHHILPQAVFGKKGKTADLCPNCHTHFHEYSKKKTKDKTDSKEAKKIWKKWFRTVSTIIAIVAIILLVKHFI